MQDGGGLGVTVLGRVLGQALQCGQGGAQLALEAVVGSVARRHGGVSRVEQPVG